MKSALYRAAVLAQILVMFIWLVGPVAAQPVSAGSVEVKKDELATLQKHVNKIKEAMEKINEIQGKIEEELKITRIRIQRGGGGGR